MEGEVSITLVESDYAMLMMALGMATAHMYVQNDKGLLERIILLTNRIRLRNPYWVPPEPEI